MLVHALYWVWSPTFCALFVYNSRILLIVSESQFLVWEISANRFPRLFLPLHTASGTLHIHSHTHTFSYTLTSTLTSTLTYTLCTHLSHTHSHIHSHMPSHIHSHIHTLQTQSHKLAHTFSHTHTMPSSTSNTLSSSLISRQLARAARERPWLSKSKVVSSSSSHKHISSSSSHMHTIKPIPKSSVEPHQTAHVSDPSSHLSSSSLISRRAARTDRVRPWLAKPNKLAAAPAVKPNPTTAAWVKSQARPITLHSALNLLPSPSPPSKRLTSWLESQVVSPVLTSIPVPTTWGRKASAYRSRRYQQAAIQSSKIIQRATAWGRKSRGLTLRQAFARISSPSHPPLAPIFPIPSPLITFDKETEDLIANVMQPYDFSPLRLQQARLIRTMDNARLQVLAGSGSSSASSSYSSPSPPVKKEVRFAEDPVTKVTNVRNWIGITAPKQDHVSGPRAFLGQLIGWTPIPGDAYSHTTIWCSGLDNTTHTHERCPNPDCHYRAKDLYTFKPLEEWTIPVFSTILSASTDQ